MKFYIATRLERHADHNIVRDGLLALGHEITYDWTTHGPVWTRGKQVIADTAVAERQGVESADVVVTLLPGGRGTHVELGIAMGKRRIIVLHSTDPNVFEATPETCAFYHLPGSLLLSCRLDVLAEAIDFETDTCLFPANDGSGRCRVPRRSHGPETWIGQRHDFDGAVERRARYAS